MKIAISSDEHGHIIDVILQELAKRGHETIYFGPRHSEEALNWPEVTQKAIQQIVDNHASEAIILCWTGTGCTIVANKFPGIRAALCHDAETARGARIWNHANVLALSLRSTPEAIVREILDTWLATPLSDDDWNLQQIAAVRQIEKDIVSPLAAWGDD